jgi:allophanate hydrolase subunit 2
VFDFVPERLADVLVVVRVQGLATVQDRGVHGFMHEALPPSGALVARLLDLANSSVGNPRDACGIEVFGRATFRALSPLPYGVDLIVAIDEHGPRSLGPGEVIEIASGARRSSYLAVRGGLFCTLFRGRQRGALLAANIGSPLVAGELVAGGGLRVDEPGGPVHMRMGKPIGLERDLGGDLVHIVPGPDHEAFTDDALATLTAAPYRILPASNRVGTRLAGAALPRRADYRQRSYPMTIGAIEVPADGQPIVFGPEHPVTGGHPLIGVIASTDLDRFHAIPLGGTVRFTVTH